MLKWIYRPRNEGQFYIAISLRPFEKKIFCITNGPISIKLDTKHHWVKGIQVCSNEGPSRFARAAYNEIPIVY